MKDRITDPLIIDAIQYLKDSLDGTVMEGFNYPYDGFVIALCEQNGYGNIMHQAANAWYKNYGTGAHTVGHCVGTIKPLLDKITEKYDIDLVNNYIPKRISDLVDEDE